MENKPQLPNRWLFFRTYISLPLEMLISALFLLVLIRQGIEAKTDPITNIYLVLL